jgi:methionyl-tRNA formyltransferase
MGAIDWTRSAFQIDCHVRAMQPWPNPFTFLSSPGKPPQRLLVLEVQPIEATAADVAPGTPVTASNGRLVVQCGERAVEILQIQPEGKRPMTAADFLRGRRLTALDQFGPGPAT